MSAHSPRRGYFLYLSPKDMATFAKRDYEALASRYAIKARMYKGTLHGIPDKFAIRFGVRGSDFNVSWFGYYQAEYAIRYSKKFGKKSVVIIGGFDVCEEEDPNLKMRLPSILYILRNADALLAISKRAMEEALRLEPDAKVELLYAGLDASSYPLGTRKEKVVVTTVYISKEHMRRKGLEVFVRSAALVPDCRFYVVGRGMDESIEYLKSISSPNVTFTGYLGDRELSNLLQQAGVYVQASTHEAFGYSMAEAMLSGCVPVVSDRGAIPEVVGDTGIYVNPGSIEDVARGIKRGFDNLQLGRSARERIATLFPLEVRRKRLIEAVERLFA